MMMCDQTQSVADRRDELVTQLKDVRTNLESVISKATETREFLNRCDSEDLAGLPIDAEDVTSAIADSYHALGNLENAIACLTYANRGSETEAE